MKKDQILQGFSRLFVTPSSPVLNKSSITECHHRLKQVKPTTSKRNRWTTIAGRKKTCKMYNIAPADHEWLAAPFERQDHCTSLSYTAQAGSVYDEKVELSTSSVSTPSSNTSTTTLDSEYEEYHCNFPSPYLSPQLEQQRSQDIPIEDRIPFSETIELADMVHCILGEAFIIADSRIFDKDDFYEPF